MSDKKPCSARRMAPYRRFVETMRMWTMIATFGTALIAPLAPAFAQAIDQIGLTGSVGPYRVGAHFTVRDHRVFVAGHYFYARRPVDIPLSGNVAAETITLHGADGATFDLHFRTNDRTATRPLSFYTSTALVGTWTDGKKTLPARLDIALVGGPQGADRYADVTKEPAPQFEARVQRFLHDVVQGDRADAASAVSFPLTVLATRTYRIRNSAQLRAAWPSIFTPCFVNALKQAVPHEMFVRNGQAMVSDGAAWFDAKGATSLNVPKCK